MRYMNITKRKDLQMIDFLIYFGVWCLAISVVFVVAAMLASYFDWE